MPTPAGRLSIARVVRHVAFTRRLSIPSALRFSVWHAMQRNVPIQISLRTGERFEIRPFFKGSGQNGDYGVANEVFVYEYYDERNEGAPDKVHLIVDLGVNIGLSLLYFLHRYPACQIIGFEPHPYHYRQALRNLTIDGTEDRVKLYALADGAKERTLWSSDQSTSSTLKGSSVPNAFSVKVTDALPLLMRERVDLLKIDIEGGEYEILADARFATLNIPYLVMEWHAREGIPDGKRWCHDRLRGLGYTIKEVFSRPSNGMF